MTNEKIENKMFFFHVKCILKAMKVPHDYCLIFSLRVRNKIRICYNLRFDSLLYEILVLTT